MTPRCGLDTLDNAKTIDLCNNPLTKEPKCVPRSLVSVTSNAAFRIDNARRVLPEWDALDKQASMQ